MMTKQTLIGSPLDDIIEAIKRLKPREVIEITKALETAWQVTT